MTATFMEVKAANLELDKDRVLDPALNTLAEAMQALAPGASPPPLPPRGRARPVHPCIRVPPALGGRLGGGRAGGGGREM